MTKIRSSEDLSAHLSRTESIESGSLEGVENVVETLLMKWPNDRGIYLQLQKLAEFISKTRTELSGLQPSEVKRDFIPKATDELDAIVEATADATHRIMDAADVVMELAAYLPKDQADRAMAAATSIFEACTFQDITGQRVTKVVQLLKVIETRIDKMVVAIGMESMASPDAAPEQRGYSQAEIDQLLGASTHQGERSSTSLLNGPALPGQGTTQAEIDAMLAG